MQYVRARWRRRAVRRGSGERRRGSTLFELLGAVTVVGVGLNALVGSLVTSIRHQASIQERCAAMDAIESTLEQLSAVPFAETFARFNRIDADDVDEGAIGSPGADFDVLGLEPLEDDADGSVGRVEFPGDLLTLREDVRDPALGMPRDLNGDGLMDDVDHAADYRILPIRIVVEWRGASGRDRVMAFTTIAGR